MDDAARQIDTVATHLALAALIRAVVADVYYTKDRAEFRRRLSLVEETAADSLAARKFWPQADDQTNELVKDIAQGFITKVITSIIHPDDRPSHERS